MENTRESRLVKTLGLIGSISGMAIPIITTTYLAQQYTPEYTGAAAGTSTALSIFTTIAGAHYGARLGRRMNNRLF